MAIKLYPLRNVPDDEAEQMRELLRTAEIEFHETNAGFIGIGTAAIWVDDPAQFEHAQSLIAEYQQQRYHQAHDQFLQRKARGDQTHFIDLLKENPARIIFYILFALFLVLIMTTPFWQ